MPANSIYIRYQMAFDADLVGGARPGLLHGCVDVDELPATFGAGC